jgi:BolA protein
MRKIHTQIEKKLKDALASEHLEVINESGQHASGPSAETHFKIICVSSQFENLSLVQRHRKIYSLLKEEQEAGVHALSFHLYTPAEWTEKQTKVPDSPQCRGGGH